MSESSPAPTNSFALLGHELWKRLTLPLGQFTYWTYVITGVVIFGGLGIWMEWVKWYFFNPDGKVTTEGIRLAITTYFPAVGCAAGYQMMLSERQRSYLFSFGFMATVLFIVCCIFTFLFGLRSPGFGLDLGIGCSVLAILLFWIANAHDKTLQDADFEAPVGGSTAVPLAGTTSGYTV